MTPPIRTCVGCRGRAEAAQLLRLVLVDGAVIPDHGRRLPGRGAWIHPRQACLEVASRRRVWVRALRAVGPVDASALDGALAGIGTDVD